MYLLYLLYIMVCFFLMCHIVIICKHIGSEKLSPKDRSATFTGCDTVSAIGGKSLYLTGFVQGTLMNSSRYKIGCDSILFVLSHGKQRPG